MSRSRWSGVGAIVPACALLSASFALPVVAQTDDVGESGDRASGETIELIVVRARKRAEAEIDVPLSMSVIGGISSSALETGAEIAGNVANLDFATLPTPGTAYGNIRGIGPLGSPLNSLDNTIGFSVDGVPTSSLGFAPALLDVSQIEVARGPQTTLFGRNALAGAINVVTREPDGTREFGAMAEGGSHGHVLAEASAGGWLAEDMIAVRGVLRYQSHDGDVPNPITGGNDAEAELFAARVALRFTPGDTFFANLSARFEDDNRNNSFLILREAPDFPKGGSDIDNTGDREIFALSLRMEKEFSSLTLTSLTGLERIELLVESDDTDSFLFGAAFGLPPEFFIAPDVDRGLTEEVEYVFSQEIRLSSSAGNTVSWVAGVNYFRSDYAQDRVQTSQFFPTLNGTNDTDIISDTISAFADISIPLPMMPKLVLSGGLRVARDEQDINSTYVSNGFFGTVPTFSQDQQFSDTYLTGRAAVTYKWTPEFVTYVSASRGYTSGGFDRFTPDAAFGVADAPFSPSRIWTYELGMKASLLDGQARLSGSVFFNDVDDGQLSVFDSTTFLFSFANQDYETVGFELEGRITVVEGLVLNAGVGYNDSELKNVGAAAAAGAANGNRVPNNTEWSFNGGISYRFDADALGLPGEFALSADYQYSDDRFADIANLTTLPSFDLVNARIEWDVGRFGLYLFGSNLTDERPQYFGAAFGPGATGVVIGRARILGGGVNVEFSSGG